MKIPRWLMYCLVLLCCLGLLIGPVLWWATWPERTAREFLTLVAEHRPREAIRMCKNNPYPVHPVALDRIEKGSSDWSQYLLTAEPRSPRDWFAGRQSFVMKDLGYRFTVERNRVIQHEQTSRAAPVLDSFSPSRAAR